MTTRDRIATSPIRYRTLGLTIKREEKNISETQCIRVKLEPARKSETDPTDSKYCYSYFCIKKEIILQQILICSEEWARELFLNGGYVYLDAIMTVVESGTEKGQMNYQGKFHGEVYETYEGISKARKWADPKALQTHFNKEIYFTGNPDLIDPKPEIEEKKEVYINGSVVQKEQLADWNTGRIASDSYEVTKAIPSGEEVYAETNLQKYFYQAAFEHTWGTITLPIKTHINYTLVWDDETHHEENVSVYEVYKVKRTYSYWRVKEISLYYLESVLIKNPSLETEKRINSTYLPQIEQILNQEIYCVEPETELTIEGGSLYGGSSCPAIPYGGAGEKVEAAVSKIRVRNDGFSVDNEIFLKSEWCESETEAPTALTEGRTLSLQENLGKIQRNAKNEFYKTTATAYYRKAGENEVTASEIEKINGIKVHTPVVCTYEITDEKKWNQQLNPSRYPSLILGKEFTIQLGAVGNHISEKGYGEKDYTPYVKEFQVCFPFEVQYGTQTIEKNTWVVLKEKKTSFFLPTQVEEKEYEIQVRALAINAENPPKTEDTANINSAHDTAERKINVTVVGRLYDFKITNVIDYPRWQSVFWNTAQKKKTGACYYAGIKNWDGILQRKKDSCYLCPILKGSHPYNKNAGPVGLGYEIEFEFQTMGQRSDKKLGMNCNPTFYYVEKDGTNRRRVRLYQKDTLEEIRDILTLKSSERTAGKRDILTWSGSCRIPPDCFIVSADADIQTYVAKKGGRISLQDAIFLKGGYLIVNLELTSCYDTKKHLSYRNEKNAKHGYCNMWETEGFQTERIDSENRKFELIQGDVFVFDCKKTIQNDYESYGTH